MFQYSHNRREEYISSVRDLHTLIKIILRHFQNRVNNINFVVENAGGNYGNNYSLSIRSANPNRINTIEELKTWIDDNQSNLRNFNSFRFRLSGNNINISINLRLNNLCLVTISGDSNNNINYLDSIFNQIEENETHLKLKHISGQPAENNKQAKSFSRQYTLQDNITYESFFEIIEDLKKDILEYNGNFQGNYKHNENKNITYHFEDSNKLEYIKDNWNNLAYLSIAFSNRCSSFTLNQHFDIKSLSLNIRTEALKDISLSVEQVESKIEQQLASSQDIQEIRKSLNGTRKKYLLIESLSLETAKNIIRCFDSLQLQNNYFKGKYEIDNNTAQYEFNSFLKWQSSIDENFKKITTFSFYSFAPDRNIDFKCVIPKGSIELNIETLGDYNEKFNRFIELLESHNIKYVLLDRNYKASKNIDRYSINSIKKINSIFKNAIEIIIKESCSENENQKYLLKTSFICAERSLEYSLCKSYKKIDDLLHSIDEERKIAFAHIALEGLLGYELGISLDTISKTLTFATTIPEKPKNIISEKPKSEALKFSRIEEIFKSEAEKNGVEITPLDSSSTNLKKKRVSTPIKEESRWDKLQSIIGSFIKNHATILGLLGVTATGGGIWTITHPQTFLIFTYPYELSDKEDEIVHVIRNTENLFVEWEICRKTLRGINKYSELDENVQIKVTVEESEVEEVNHNNQNSYIDKASLASNKQSVNLKDLKPNTTYRVDLDITKPLRNSRRIYFKLSDDIPNNIQLPKYKGCSSILENKESAKQQET